MASSSSVEGRIPFKIHPRVFAALGADLVTNDVVAIIELVKNSYDAFATTVDIRFEQNTSPSGGNKIGETQPNGNQNTHERIEYAYLEILDDGSGMDRRTLEQAWCVVATPYRQQHPYESKDKKVRRVAGEKGLGRLSAARLGSRLEMLTKAAGSPCWLVTVDWSGLAEKDDLEGCYASCVRFTGTAPFNGTGTRIRILDLSSEWESDQIDDLRDNLARLVSPFSKIDDFNIRLHAPALGEQDSPDILAPDFLSRPPYAIRGHANPEGAVTARYEFKPIVKAKPRSTQIVLAWPEVRDASDTSLKVKSLQSPGCGPFEFDIRAWDIGADDTQEIAEHFHIAKGNIRKAIRAHKGISLYRDNILVLPKSDDARDWLGLDLRRISRVGDRLSTSQIVGYVSISADKNRQIADTSDREDLAQNSAVLAFKKLLIAIIDQLEIQRDADRLKPGDKIKLKDLLEGVSADDLTEEVSSLAEEGASVKEVAQRVQDFNARLRIVREALKTRFVYYSRLATIGTIAQMLVHEIRNRTTAIGRFIRTAKSAQLVADSPEFNTHLKAAESAAVALESLAETFAPLASRGFRRGHRDAVVEESIVRCLTLSEAELKKAGIAKPIPPKSTTRVAVDPGELDTILLNLILNALYWIPKSRRRPQVTFSIRKLPSDRRVAVTVNDSGEGISDDDADRIFLPGVTRKPGGIGMGLTVAAELVSEYGGNLVLVQPGKLAGASFTFDLPLKA